MKYEFISSTVRVKVGGRIYKRVINDFDGPFWFHLVSEKITILCAVRKSKRLEAIYQKNNHSTLG
jgi:hypothetical protein